MLSYTGAGPRPGRQVQPPWPCHERTACSRVLSQKPSLHCALQRGFLAEDWATLQLEQAQA